MGLSLSFDSEARVVFIIERVLSFLAL
jgi:hypothetical protein